MYKSTLLANLDKVVKVMLASGILVIYLRGNNIIWVKMMLLKFDAQIELFNLRLIILERSVIIILVVKCLKIEVCKQT